MFLYSLIPYVIDCLYRTSYSAESAEKISNAFRTLFLDKQKLKNDGLIKIQSLQIKSIKDTLMQIIMNYNTYIMLTTLNELLQFRDGMLCLSDDSFSSNDVAQLFSFLCTS